MMVNVSIFQISFGFDLLEEGFSTSDLPKLLFYEIQMTKGLFKNQELIYCSETPK